MSSWVAVVGCVDCFVCWRSRPEHVDPCEGCLFALRAAACHQFGVFVMFDDDDDDDDDDNIFFGLFGIMNISI